MTRPSPPEIDLLIDIAADWLGSRGRTAFDFQRAAWRACLEGRSGLINAPTGSGKTFAAWIGPLLAAVTPAHRGVGAREKTPADPCKPPTPRHVAMNWARRLKRVFGIEIECGAHRGGKLRILASIEEPQGIATILSHLQRTVPERDQPHGAESRAALARLVARRSVELKVVTQDQYDRVVAVVYVDDVNVNEQLVRDDHAWTRRRFLTDQDFFRWEDAARRARKGLWSLPERTWIYPSDWRLWRPRQIEFVRHFSSETAARCIAAIGADERSVEPPSTAGRFAPPAASQNSPPGCIASLLHF